MEFDIDPKSWAITKLKLRQSYIFTEKSYKNVKLLDVICIIMSHPNVISDMRPLEPVETKKLQLGYQVLAEVSGQIVSTTGFWDEAVNMSQEELNDDAMARVSQWVMALNIIEIRKKER